MVKIVINDHHDYKNIISNKSGHAEIFAIYWRNFRKQKFKLNEANNVLVLILKYQTLHSILYYIKSELKINIYKEKFSYYLIKYYILVSLTSADELFKCLQRLLEPFFNLFML